MKHFNSVRKYGAGLALSLVATSVFAADPYAAITAAVDFDGVTPVIIAAAAALAIILVLRKGVRFALSMVK
ncbi:MAG: hypothetical protein SXG53_22860 [Pseudomonadota bacterium]|nr:hypothetical protein [Pseudomonadota bacterium]